MDGMVELIGELVTAMVFVSILIAAFTNVLIGVTM